ncbi:metalloprotein [Pasteurellaceae bacterium Pebbles2]|nr:metalloprotein [Pasteurellaceae bacterium Pebbles2]
MTHCLFSHSSLATQQDFLQFQQKIATLAQEIDVNLNDFVIDHLALRVNSEDSAKNWLELLLKCGTILSDNIVNGRVIYLIQLNEPLIFAGQPVEIIELPFPKNKCYPLESWEHIEIVMPFDEGETSLEWVNRLEKIFFWNELTTLNVKVSEPKVEGERLPNPSIALSFADKSKNDVCIKVHPYHIKTIIEV